MAYSECALFSVAHSGLGLLVDKSIRIPHTEIRDTLLEIMFMIEQNVWKSSLGNSNRIVIVDARSPSATSCFVTPPHIQERGAIVQEPPWDLAIVYPPFCCRELPKHACPENVARMAIFASEKRHGLDRIPWCYYGKSPHKHHLHEAYTTSNPSRTLPKTLGLLTPTHRPRDKTMTILNSWIDEITHWGTECLTGDMVLGEIFSWTRTRAPPHDQKVWQIASGLHFISSLHSPPSSFSILLFF